MINPLRLFGRALATPKTAVFLYSAIAMYSASKLVSLVKEQMRILDRLDQAVADHRAEYDELCRQHQALLDAHAGVVGEYPGSADVDPLARGATAAEDTGELPLYVAAASAANTIQPQDRTVTFNAFDVAGAAADAG